MERTYAILGATGNAGQSILKILETREDVRIHAFVRSRSKLEKLSPKLCASPHMEIFEGTIDQEDVLARCLSGVDAIILAVSAAENYVGCRIAQDTAESVVNVLQKLRKENPELSSPMLVVFSSAEADDKFFYDTPWPLRNILYTASYFIYEDLKAAEKYLRQHDWIDVVFMKSGGISTDAASGHFISEEKSQTFVSWPDVAGAMVQLADEGKKWSGKNVSVTSKKKAKPEYGNAPLLFYGLSVTARSFLPI